VRLEGITLSRLRDGHRRGLVGIRQLRVPQAAQFPAQPDCRAAYAARVSLRARKLSRSAAVDRLETGRDDQQSESGEEDQGMRRMAAAAAVAVIGPLAGASGALAHPHAAEHAHGDAGQLIANGQNHPAFINGESCETFTHLPGYGPAWYGLETAHHGPDAGDPGRGDGCYQIEGRLSPLDPASDRNPGIE
jgi:uncharacterized membrane protein